MSVYFAQAGPFVKIGYSADPVARSTTVTTNGTRPADLPRGASAKLLGWLPGGRHEEAALHRLFAADHVAGEWFYLDPETVRDLLWADPRGVDVHRMSMQAVCVALRFPTLTRDQIEQAGVPVEAVPLSDLVIAS